MANSQPDYGSVEGGEQPRHRQSKGILIGLLALAVTAVVATLSSQALNRTEVLGQDDESSALQNLLNAPKMEAAHYAELSKRYSAQAAKDASVIAQARQEEEAADALAAKDASQLSALSASVQAAPKGGEVNTLKQQLSNLDSKLQSLDSRDSYDSSPRPADEDSVSADTLRAHQAMSVGDSRNIRRALDAARVAAKRAAEAKVIAENEDAIARSQAARVAQLEAQQRAAMGAASQAEASMRTAARADRAEREDRFHSAMRTYTGQLQGYVAQDMETLGHLKAAEASAAVGPYVASSVWSQPPGPAAAASGAPVALASTQAAATQALTQTGGGLARAMGRAQRQLRRLTRLESVGDAAVAALSAAPPSGAHTQALVERPPAAPATAAPAGDAFTSFAGGRAELLAAADGDATLLDDGALIRHASNPVALVRIPLGAHEDARKGRRGVVKAPKMTIRDRSTEAEAVRADGSHWSVRSRAAASAGRRHVRRPAGRYGNQLLQVHMPHVA